MSYTYEQRKRPQGQQNTSPERTTAPGPTMDALLSGAAAPTAAQKGRPIDLDGAMKAKMEHAFGDLSAVKLYESQAVGDAGAEAIARGSEIAFAPGMADFSTRSGQERLGHELSHVMSQRSGAVRGQGFLANSALEARADREGAMAAAGEQVYTGPVTHALSDASPSPAVAGPMQAKRKTDEEKRVSRRANRLFAIQNGYNHPDEPGEFGPESLVTQMEGSFYNFETSEPDLPMMLELARRRDKYAKKMIKQRNKFMRKNKGMSQSRANYNARFTDAGQDYDTYSSILDQMSNAYVGNSEEIIDQFNDEMNSAPDDVLQMRTDAQLIAGNHLDKLADDDFLTRKEYEQMQEQEEAKEPLLNRRRKKLYNKYRRG